MGMVSTLAELQRAYGGKTIQFVEIVDRDEAQKHIECRCVCCWGSGQKYGDMGWVLLSSPSKTANQSKRTVFVCRESLLNGHRVSAAA